MFLNIFFSATLQVLKENALLTVEEGALEN